MFFFKKKKKNPRHNGWEPKYYHFKPKISIFDKISKKKTSLLLQINEIKLKILTEPSFCLP